ncbi:MAG: NAD kinase [Alkalibacterium sp.]|uniref:NAD kinase n=1 Tax=Alkalibacterium gilvum TaxID=1130080 RepID=A0A1H6THU5_9LACT|nr:MULTISPECIES: NAD kinase [Alkalibacterium]MDN6293152.1 NAD kinase [Alkalibacterium sp.]MDN6294944.1 NAD kinase [Alkalibacterium sp.]MDN6398315.1 NAD kinase [Alkalibacterium sp.]MDN6729593.1 NAD kinase [Alkalibacterium sp.]SEI77744.1 NAD+ kinase [Alkalibacterium gilvum]
MKIAIVKNNTEESTNVARKLREMLAKENIEITTSQPNIIISVGGDGTLLSAFHRYAHLLDKVRFIGVHTGHLGFYTDWRQYNLEELVDSLVNDNGEYIQYPLLDIEIIYKNKQKNKHFLALNESIVKFTDGTLVGDVYIKEEYFERFRGDGLCISTPTGSTGYNKSIGGAVLHPRLEALQLTEIASLNNRIFRTLSSPMVIAPDEWIKIEPIDTSCFTLTIDQLASSETDVDYIKFQIAKERIRFAQYQHTHFWDRVEDAFLGAKFNNEN